MPGLSRDEEVTVICFDRGGPGSSDILQFSFTILYICSVIGVFLLRYLGSHHGSTVLFKICGFLK
jgi:hypothetical protein